MTQFVVQERPVKDFADFIQTNPNAKSINEKDPKFFKKDDWYLFPHQKMQMVTELQDFCLKKLKLSQEETEKRLDSFFTMIASQNYWTQQVLAKILHKDYAKNEMRNTKLLKLIYE